MEKPLHSLVLVLAGLALAAAPMAAARPAPASVAGSSETTVVDTGDSAGVEIADDDENDDTLQDATSEASEGGMAPDDATASELAADAQEDAAGADRLVTGHSHVLAVVRQHSIARFGPFVVLDGAHAALVGATDGRTPLRFVRMLQAFPAIRVIELVECPGTVDDTANLRLGRMIRARGLVTDVPSGGSVRSGAVELFLAGAERHAAPDAVFAVHSWQDDIGRQPQDFAADAPVNRAYINYYHTMGMSREEAVAFYALTNSVPNNQVLWLRTDDIARYARLD